MDKYFKDHWTLSEWLARSTRRDAIIAEDASKRSRLATLRSCAGIPSVETIRFPYSELLEHGARISEFAETCGDTPHALRLTPLSAGQVLRDRGKPVRELLVWARALQAPADAYECTFERHVESKSSAIFVCAESGVWGEFHEGPLLELNRGTASDAVTHFSFHWRQTGIALPELVARALRYLEISDEDLRQFLQDECGADFAENRLLGYFEVIRDASGELWFVDYNRLLIAELPHVRHKEAVNAGVVLTGQTGSRGTGHGIVLHAPDMGVTHVPDNTVLVARATRPELIEMMASSRAVVTEVGGVLSHAAIACRELGIPCVVGVKGATSTLAEGVEVIVDADAGKIDILNER
ncbi:MAG TPA: PEP-utilizing enzyme [Actinophytocola sp.]|uniref:PEP-utilizing enzyme n=1 Tax=Actinophytocola sp. TaxID=1872138 RepID=UPI002DDDAF24|nr:PEP-utilizing enzyme [Actinophytocola sp.]HEV2778887.1 PEP-utilizing enzyme [Actinophytocola sp.]